SYVDDPEVSEYLAALGSRLSQASIGARQDFEFFAIRDPSINAFALPGGFIAVHTGLISTSETESELASVLSHEIAHVTQRHIARMLGQQQQMQMPMLAALAAAILLGRSRPDLASGAAVAAQAGAVQTQLSYSRDFEREADRLGFRALETAGFDPHAMAGFFEKMQRASRIADDGTMPGYLRTHPVTIERIADAQNRATRATRSAISMRSCARDVTPARPRRATGSPRRCCARGARAMPMRKSRACARPAP